MSFSLFSLYPFLPHSLVSSHLLFWIGYASLFRKPAPSTPINRSRRMVLQVLQPSAGHIGCSIVVLGATFIRSPWQRDHSHFSSACMLWTCRTSWDPTQNPTLGMLQRFPSRLWPFTLTFTCQLTSRELHSILSWLATI